MLSETLDMGFKIFKEQYTGQEEVCVLCSILIPFSFKIFHPILLKSYAVLDKIKSGTQEESLDQMEISSFAVAPAGFL